MVMLSTNKNELVSSEFIAGSININRAIVRKEISNLKDRGLIESKEGKGGGSMLAKPAKDIRLNDIYQAVRQASLLGGTNITNPKCPVGKVINEHIDILYSDAEEALVKKLDKITLAEFTKSFH